MVHHRGTILATDIGEDVPVGGLGFGMDDVNEKVGIGYQILNLSSTIRGWLDRRLYERTTAEHEEVVLKYSSTSHFTL